MNPEEFEKILKTAFDSMYSTYFGCMKTSDLQTMGTFITFIKQKYKDFLKEKEKDTTLQKGGSNLPITMSKKEICEKVINKFLEDDNFVGATTWNDLNEGMVYQSSTLGIAMEYLGLLKTQSIIDYVSTRGGIFSVDETLDGFRIVSFREFLDSHPLP